MIRQRRQRRGRPTAGRLARGELDRCASAEAPDRADARRLAALAVAARGAGGAVARSAGACPATSGASSPQATPSARTVPAARSAAASTASASRSPGARCSRPQGGRLNWSDVDALVAGRRRGRPRRAALPLRRARPGRCRPSCPVRAAAKRRRPCRSRPAPSAPPGRTSSSWRSLATGPAAPSGPRTRACRASPIRTWQIWNEQNFKYFVVRPNPAEYGKLVNVSYAAIKAVDPGAKIDPRRHVRPAERGDLQERSRRRPTSPPTSSTRCTDDAGDQVASSAASPCTPTRAATRT